MPISVQILGSDALNRAGRWFSGERDRLRDRLSKATETFGHDAEGRSKKDYLRGPRPQRLDVISGRLRSSVRSKTTTSGDTVQMTLGTNVDYAPAHELGFHGIVNVPAHQRIVKKVFGKDVNVTVANVRAHTRRMNLRERAFLNPAVHDALPAFEKDIRDALHKVGMGGDLA